MDSSLRALKISYQGEIHRLRIDLSQFSLSDLTTLFESTFHLGTGSFVVQYKDNEGDCLNITCQAEFEEAIRVFYRSADEVQSLRFYGVSKTQAAFQENIADPILKAIEKLVESLNTAMERIKKEEWAQRAHAKAQESRVVLGEVAQTTGTMVKESYASAKKTLSEIQYEQLAKDTYESAKKTLSELQVEQLAKESYDAAKKTLSEIPYDQIANETREVLHLTAEQLASFSQSVVEQYGSLTREEAPPAPVVAEDGSVTDEEEEEEEEAVQVVAEEPKAEEPEVLAQDSEWEQVAETPAIAVAAPSEEELKWADQLAVIKEVFPEVDVTQAMALLETSRGNVHVVLNSLFEL